MKPKPRYFHGTPLFGAMLRCGTPVFIGFTVLVTGLTSEAAIFGGLSGGQTTSSQGAGAANPTVPASATAARDNATAILNRTNTAVGAALALQQAARAAAASATNAGPTPGKPGVNLPNVPNGLDNGPGLGGLYATGGNTNPTKWTGANAPTQTTPAADGSVQVTIKQTTQQALLNWDTFNVGNKTTVTFDQTAGSVNAGQWIAFNKVSDSSGNPTQILGSIKADGQVYIINPNGIIFGGSSQVNVHNLTASSLPINDALVTNGLLNTNSQFLFDGLGQGTMGDVTVQAGAQLSCPSTADHTGGRVALIGANVTNQGTISTPDGQTILAAGLQVAFKSHSYIVDSTGKFVVDSKGQIINDASLRGLDVFIGAVTDPASALAPYAGTASNLGVISIARADVTITGKTVNQFGVIDGSTSVSLNGRVDLLAEYNAISNAAYDPSNTSTGVPYVLTATGLVDLGPGSVTRILPEWDSKDTAIDSLHPVTAPQLTLPSTVKIEGKVIHMESQSSIFAPNANVTVNSGIWDPTATTQSVFVHSEGQIYLDSGSTINVAGSADVAANVQENIVAVQLRGAELANSPVLREGALRGMTLYVNALDAGVYDSGRFAGTSLAGNTWVGTPLGDVSGYVKLIPHTVGELTTAGGTVNLTSGGSVIVNSGASVDVSGGWTNYQGSTVQVSRVFSGGNLIDSSKAFPDMVYNGIATGISLQTSAKWNITDSFTTPFINGVRYQEGYINGANGGSLAISAPSVALDGKFTGGTTIGTLQRTNATTPATPASFTLSLKSQQLLYPYYPDIYPTSLELSIQKDATQTPADPFQLDTNGDPVPLRSDRLGKVLLPTGWFGPDGFGNLSISNPDGKVVVPAGETLTVAAGGGITLTGATIDVEGTLKAPGGSISLTSYNISPADAASIKLTTKQTPDPSIGRGIITLGASAMLDAKGLQVDDRVDSSAPLTLPLITDGGSVSITGYSVKIEKGGLIDASGGVAISSNGKISYGKGGSISISAGQDPGITSVLGGQLQFDSTFTTIVNGQQQVHSTLSAFSGSTGGSLSLLAPAIVIGNGSPAGTNVLSLDAGFFSEGGFNSFSLAGIGLVNGTVTTPGVLITAGTVIQPVVTNLIADQTLIAQGLPGLSQIIKEPGVRTPVNISLSSTGVKDYFDESRLLVRGDVVDEAGSVIRVEPGGNLSLIANKGTISVAGSLYAPGGTITVAGADKYPSNDPHPSNALITVDLLPGSVLSTAGVEQLKPDPYGRRIGNILKGGTVSVTGNIAAEAGALIDVSGASGILDLTPGALGLTTNGSPSSSNSTSDGLVTIPTLVASNSGSIVLNGAQELFCDATLKGSAGGSNALGGSITISSGRFYLTDATQNPLDINLQVSQNDVSIPAPFSGVGHTVVDAHGANVPEQGYFAVNTFISSGCDSLTLGGNVFFHGPVNLTASSSLTIATGGILEADSSVNLSASHVAIGRPFRGPLSLQEMLTPDVLVSPTTGTGALTVKADLIDIGNVSLQKVSSAGFIASNGDIRGDGTLDVQGHILLEAGQIYPTTDCSFNVFAYDSGNGSTLQQGSVTIVAAGSRQLPLSAVGRLGIYASTIDQGGVLRAPFGSITLGWNGTGTAPVDKLGGSSLSVPVTTSVTLESGSILSVSAVDPATGKALTLPYGLVSNGSSWITPSGVDITSGGLLAKGISLSAATVSTVKGSKIDISGGGDLYAYEWVAGLQGNVDILASNASFAVIPGYSADYTPFAPFQGGSTGYVMNPTLSAAGNRIYLQAGGGLQAGYYTLLPARYALLPGAFLVTPVSQAPGAPAAAADGSAVVSGYRFNDLNHAVTPQAIFTSFNVASSAVVSSPTVASSVNVSRSQYDAYYANTFLLQGSSTAGLRAPRLPIDAAELSLAATVSMNMSGSVLASVPTGGRGGQVDLSSPLNILIAAPGTAPITGTLVLDSSQLTAFGVQSLLIGGSRTTTEAGTTVDVATNLITVDNAGSPLSGPDIILVAKQGINFSPNADVESSGTLTGSADSLLIGSSATPGSGDGVLVRVSSDAGASILRSGLSGSTSPLLTISAGAKISGSSVIIDSSARTILDPSASLRAVAASINTGLISIQLDNPGTLTPGGALGNGLVLSGTALQDLQSSAHSLSLTSYSSIDIYGSGQIGQLNTDGSPIANSISMHAGEIRGFNTAGKTVKVSAKSITLDNANASTGNGSVASDTGSLEFDAGTILIGQNALAIDQYSGVILHSTGGILATGTGTFSTSGSLTAQTPLIATAKGANSSWIAAGAMDLQKGPSGSLATITPGLGGTLNLQGAGLIAGSNLTLHGGNVSLRSTAGDIQISGIIDAGGYSQSFGTAVKYVNGGNITLVSDSGDVKVSKYGTLSVAANSGGGNAGLLSVSAQHGSMQLDSGGTLSGAGGQGGNGGSFTLDVGSLGSTAALNAALDLTSFSTSRSIRVRDGNVTVDGTATSRSFSLSADHGSITVTGTGIIDAHGATGGSISLFANGSVTLENKSNFNVTGAQFDNAGKGGSIDLEAGTEQNGIAGTGVVDIQTGSTLNLSVTAATSSSEAGGLFTGTLHIRAPQNTAGTNLGVNPINGTITGASKIEVEGYKIYDLTISGGLITSGLQSGIINDANNFVNNYLGASVTTATAYYDAIANGLLNSNPNKNDLKNLLLLMAGVEIINHATTPSAGNLVLGSTSSASSADWNLSTARFGPLGTSGMLTMRATGNLVFYNALSDGFKSSLYTSALNTPNSLLKANAQSWSYRLTAGADLSAADFRGVQALSNIEAGSGSLLLGKNGGVLTATTGNAAVTRSFVPNLFQVIRTGSGDITINAGQDVELLNQFATIYTAGTLATDQTLGGTFALPTPRFVVPYPYSTGNLGTVQQDKFTPIAQYTYAGGNVNISAQQDITHLTVDNSTGQLVPDSERQMPENWLYRRGDVDPNTGLFAKSHYGESASTTWWVDYCNFFEGVGALGGGNVAMHAGRDVSNVDAVAPTNARMPSGTPSASALVEYGGGDVTVTAGRDISGGVYYVERGTGTLIAGRAITTNSTRSPSLTNLSPSATNSLLDPSTWLPTTLFLGKGSFDVTSGGDMLLGPVANAFLLPEGYNNSYWYKSYFSTYAASDSINVTSLGGSITFRESVTTPSSGSTPVLKAWFKNELLLDNQSASYLQPWLRLDETSVDPFSTAFALLPSTLKAVAYSGDINLVGNLTLAPSPTGTLELLAKGAIKGLQSNGVITQPDNTTLTAWVSSSINLSDTDPSKLPSDAAPIPISSLGKLTDVNFMLTFDSLFNETGSTNGTLQTKQVLHTTGILHAGDTDPLRLYAGTGDITDLTLYSPKPVEITAGQDIRDIAFYIQNTSTSSVSVVSAGRDIIAYDANSPLLVASKSNDNSSHGNPQSGDIQIGGQGSLEILAGRNLDLGTGNSNPDGTGTGITSIGNLRDPYLPFDKPADIICGAGVGGVTGGLSDSASNLDFKAFIKSFVSSPSGARYLAESAGILGVSGESVQVAGDGSNHFKVNSVVAGSPADKAGIKPGDVLLSISGKNIPSSYDDSYLFSSVEIGVSTNLAILRDGKQMTVNVTPGTNQIKLPDPSLTSEQQDQMALSLFYLVLRDAGRDHNDPQKANYREFTDGYNAIKALFPETKTWNGDIQTRSRDIRSKTAGNISSGGNISLFAPGGGVTLANTILGNPPAPPGIITEEGGNISVFTHTNVNLGSSRIFTLRGGNEIIWSSVGNIAAGSSSKTLPSASPTRALYDIQSANVSTDIAGLATGGGIGVLASVAGVAPGNVDLFAPVGTIDAGDAGINATGNVNIAAAVVINSSNIAAGGASTGTAPSTPSAPSVGSISAASTAAGASTATVENASRQESATPPPPAEEPPSVITVEVIGYGGGGGGENGDSEEDKRKDEHSKTEDAQ